MASPPAPRPAARTLERSRIVIACSRPGCNTSFTWLGAYHLSSPDETSADHGAAIHAAAQIGWTFPAAGNVCPRPHQEAS